MLLNNYNLDIFYLKGNPKRMPSKVKNIVVYGMVLQAMFDFSLMGTLLRYDSVMAKEFALDPGKAFDVAYQQSLRSK